jgi:uncharacterized alkaline shock family protein YloU
MWSPVISWHQIGIENRTVATVNGIVEYHNYSVYRAVVSRIVIKATTNLTGTKYMSTSRFDLSTKHNESFIHTTATNVPDYSFTWTSPAINVMYGPRSVTTSKSSDTDNRPTEMTCSADGNPPPTYRWLNGSTNVTLHVGATFDVCTVVTDTARLEHFVCVATNNVNTAVASVNVDVTNCNTARQHRQEDEATLKKSCVIPVIVASALALVLGITTTVFIMRFRQDRRISCNCKNRTNGHGDAIVLHTVMRTQLQEQHEQHQQPSAAAAEFMYAEIRPAAYAIDNTEVAVGSYEQLPLEPYRHIESAYEKLTRLPNRPEGGELNEYVNV